MQENWYRQKIINANQYYKIRRYQQNPSRCKQCSFTNIYNSKRIDSHIHRRSCRVYWHLRVWVNDPEDLSPVILERATDEGRRGFSRIDATMVLHFRDWHIVRQYCTAGALSIVVVIVVTGKMHLGSIPEPSCPFIVGSTCGVLREFSLSFSLSRSSANAFRIVHPVVYLREVLFSPAVRHCACL